MRNSQFFKERNILAVNLISSPGSGKTTLLEQMARLLGRSMAVIVGDIQTRRDAQRIEVLRQPGISNRNKRGLPSGCPQRGPCLGEDRFHRC